MEGSRLYRLAGFVKLLEHRLDYSFEVEREFEDRLRLQKYVYLARFFGLDVGYSFSMYYHGPYSPELADDYYELSKWVVKPDVREISWDKEDAFIDLVSGKDAKWLELAATIMSVYEGNNEKIKHNELVGIVKLLKSWTDEDEIKEIIEELSIHGLIRGFES